MIKADKSTTKTLKELALGKEDSRLEQFDLIEVQRQSWDKFVNVELRKVISDFFPIDDYTGKKFTLHFEDFYLGF